MAKSKKKSMFTKDAYPSEEEMKKPQESPDNEPQLEIVDDADAVDDVSDDEPVTPEVQDDMTSNEAETMVSRDELARAVAEAEQRGYLRGRNEAMSHPMRRNGIWEQPHREEDIAPVNGGDDEADDLVLLRRIRPSIWD